MLIIKNTGLAMFKVKFAANTPESVKKRCSDGTVGNSETLTIPTDCLEYIDLAHIKRCGDKHVIKVFSIRDRVVVDEPLKASVPKAKNIQGKKIDEVVTNA
jgi:hypothetical protein